ICTSLGRRDLLSAWVIRENAVGSTSRCRHQAYRLKAEQMTRNTQPLSLHVPEPSGRPGDPVDFSHLKLDAAGAVDRPPVDSRPVQLLDLAFRLIRVLDDEGNAVGPWNPRLDAETARRGLKAMILTRAFDDRMHRAHRQGKTSFYMKCTGEEAIAVAQ